MKERSDAILRGLTAEQRAKLDGWLFEEGWTLAEAAAECGRFLGKPVSKSSVGRYYQREGPKRLRAEVMAGISERGTPDLKGLEANYDAVIQRLLTTALEAAHDLENPRNARLVKDFMQVVIASKRLGNDAMRAITIREKFEFDVATECLIHQAKLTGIVEDESLDDTARINKIRQELFGDNLPE